MEQLVHLVCRGGDTRQVIVHLLEITGGQILLQYAYEPFDGDQGSLQVVRDRVAELFQLGVLGFKIGMDGEEVLDVPCGVQPGYRLTIPGAGVPNLRGVGRGDLFVEIDVRVPKKLSKEQKEILEKYAEVSGEEVGGSATGFFQRIFRD